jgi:hypothetical protein
MVRGVEGGVLGQYLANIFFKLANNLFCKTYSVRKGRNVGRDL